jgi:peptidylprolyl isomerase
MKCLLKVILAMALLVVSVSAAACSNPDAAQVGDTVKVDYHGTLDDGTVFDSTINESFGHPDPLEFTIGANQMIPGFDNAVRGMEEGQTKTVTIPSKDAYGEKYFEVPLSELPEDLQVGETLIKQLENGGQIQAIVANISDTTATLENTHDYAGEDLTFEITMVQITKPAETG